MDFEELKVRLSDKPATFYVMCAAIVLAIVFSIITGVSNSKKAAEYQAEVDRNNTTLVDLRSQVAGLSTAPEPDSVEDVTTARHYAKDAGTTVATRQSRYCDLAAGGWTERYEADLLENAQALDIYFAEDSKNARTPWFSADDAFKSRFVWEFRTNYAFTGKNTECLWICRDVKESGGSIVAFTLATYDAETNLFSGVKTYMTSYGQSTYCPSTPSGDSIGSIVPDEAIPPDGNYGVSGDGTIVNENGEPYVTDDGKVNTNEDNSSWASEFEKLFKESQEYREQVAKQNGGG